MNKQKKLLINFTKLLVSGVLLYLLVKKIGIYELVDTLKGIDVYYFFWAVVFTLIGFLIQVTRLRILIQAQDTKIGFWQVFEFNLTSTFFGIFLPTVVGGDVVKMALLGSYSGKKAVSVGTITMDRVIGVYALVVVAFISGIFGKNLLNADILRYTIDAFSIVFIFILILNIKSLWGHVWKFLAKILGNKIDPLKTFVGTLQSYKMTEPPFIKAFVWSLFFYMSIITANYLIALSLGLNVNFLVFFVFVPLLSLAGMIPISLSGLGVREAISVVFFSTMGIGSNYAALLSFLPFLIKACFGLVGGVKYAFSGGGKAK